MFVSVRQRAHERCNCLFVTCIPANFLQCVQGTPFKPIVLLESQPTTLGILASLQLAISGTDHSRGCVGE